jgi:hypothetical protein
MVLAANFIFSYNVVLFEVLPNALTTFLILEGSLWAKDRSTAVVTVGSNSIFIMTLKSKIARDIFVIDSSTNTLVE